MLAELEPRPLRASYSWPLHPSGEPGLDPTGSTVSALMRHGIREHPRNEPGEHALRRVESLGELASRSDPKLAVGA